MVCKWVRLAYRFMPLPAWRAFLLDRHIDRCPHCQGEALDAAAIRSLVITDEQLGDEPPLRPFAAAQRPAPTHRRFPAWRYAYAFFLAAAVLGAAAWLAWLIPQGKLPEGIVTVLEADEDARVFAVLDAKVGSEPARPVIFKPGQPGMTIVWFEKAKN
jgi:hypothetical protein